MGHVTYGPAKLTRQHAAYGIIMFAYVARICCTIVSLFQILDSVAVCFAYHRSKCSGVTGVLGLVTKHLRIHDAQAAWCHLAACRLVGMPRAQSYATHTPRMCVCWCVCCLVHGLFIRAVPIPLSHLLLHSNMCPCSCLFALSLYVKCCLNRLFFSFPGSALGSVGSSSSEADVALSLC